MLEFNIRVRVCKYDEIAKHRNPFFNYDEDMEKDIQQHLEFAIMHSPYIVHSQDEILIYNIAEIKRVES